MNSSPRLAAIAVSALMLAAATSTARAEPAQHGRDPGRDLGRDIEREVRRGMDRAIDTLRELMRTLPQFERPTLDENGNIVIPRRKPDAPPAPRRGPAPDEDWAAT
ncbi:MAG: hypothetical protein FJX67_12385 [Alphaproteobacteria bacterium]|nr:hypothetical protein [Alphaproteobacteria bacterium]